MSVSFDIQSSAGPYQVRIESGGLSNRLQRARSASVIADQFFTPLFDSLGLPAVFVEATEENKSLNASPAFIERLRKSGVNRQTELASVGGGIVQDISAFIASVYMRGLTWTYFPTTVLAMVDSCIGGKSSINVGPYKNLVGTFHPPKEVFVDPSLVQTLPEDQRASGLIEAAKICFCRGADAFEQYLSFRPSVAIETSALGGLVETSLRAKKWFIEVDEFDKNERLLLNFGHTFGHAMEGATHFAIPHGIAVGLGILCALEFERASGTDYGHVPRVAKLENHLEEMIHSQSDLPGHLRSMPLHDVVERFASDKKHRSEEYTVVVVDSEGQVKLKRVPKAAAVTAEISNSVKNIVERFS